MKRYFPLLLLFIFAEANVFAQQKNKATTTTTWRGMLKRADGKAIHFNFEEKRKGDKISLTIRNGSERLKVDSVRVSGDSLFIKMPVFESSFRIKMNKDKWQGLWTRGSSSKDIELPFEAIKSSDRYIFANGVAGHNLNGRWAVMFSSDTGKAATSVAEFSQKGSRIIGTFITPTGDYRYLDGIVSGNMLTLSGFDGAHAVLYEAEVSNGNTLSNGHFYSGPKYSEAWSAVRNTKATVKLDESAMFVRPGEQKLNFTFPDLDSNMVSVKDERFKNKVVIIQLMGSWCPNCMDETVFLSDFYTKNKKRGVEIIGLAYEYSTDFSRSRNSLLKFQKRFNIQYPVLITGVKVSDSLRTEKTLPQVTPIKVFPSSIVLDKKGNIRKLDNGFVGPATGEHYAAYKRAFNQLIDELLRE